MANVFISYSRRDTDFARKLHVSLEAIKGEDKVWIDWEGIASAAPDFVQEIYAGIESADTFLLIVTPDSLKSEICHLEIDHAIHHAKRVIPVVHVDVVEDGKLLGEIVREWFNTNWEDRARHNWDTLSHINWLLFRDVDDFDAAFNDLVSAINVDLDHVKFHTRLTVRAREWQAQNEDTDLVLHGDDLNAAEGWLAISENKEPPLTELQRKYIQASVAVRASELESERAVNQRLRYLLAASVLLLVIAFGFAIVAFRQNQTATDERNNAQTQGALAIIAQERAVMEAANAQTQEANAQASLIETQNIQALFLADLSDQHFDEFDYRTSLNLALESVRMRDDDVVNPQSYASLVNVINRGDFPIFSLLQDSALDYAEWNADQSRIVMNLQDGTAEVWQIPTLGGDVTEARRLVTLEGDAPMARARWNADGSRILMTTYDDTATVWELSVSSDGVEAGSQLFTVQHEALNPNSVALWNADESQILTVSYDGRVNLWDAADGSLLVSIHHETPDFEIPADFGASWNADESQILTFQDNGDAIIWDAADGSQLYTMHVDDGQETGLYSAAWSTDGSRILTTSSDGIVRIWQDGSPVFTLQSDQPLFYALWNGDESRVLTTSQDSTATVWELPIFDGQVPDAADGGQEASQLFTLEREPETQIYGALWNADDSQILGGGDDNSVRIWSAADGSLLRTLKHDNWIVNATWNTDESQILTVSFDGSVFIWNAENENPRVVLRDVSFNGMQWSRDKSRILSWSYDGTRHISSAEDGGELLSLSGVEEVRIVAWSPNENRILTVSKTNVLRIWDGADGSELVSLEPEESVYSVEWSSDQSRILTLSYDGNVQVWSAEDGSQTASIEDEQAFWHAHWSADGSRILTVSEDGTARIWNAADGSPLLSLEHEAHIVGAGWNQDDSHILTWAEDGVVRVFDAADGSEVLTLMHDAYLSFAQWNEDETRIVAQGYISVFIWDAADGSLLFTLEHGDWVSGMAWNTDGSRILTWTVGNEIFVWNAADDSLIYSFQSEETVGGARWNADETGILVWSIEGTLREWLIDLDQLLERGDSLLQRPLNNEQRAQFFLPTLVPSATPADNEPSVN